MNRQDPSGEARDKAKAELEKLLSLMGYEAKVEAFAQGEDEILLHIEAADAARLIGRGAQVLDALQYILNRTLYKQDIGAMHCVVDIERYRERHKDRLLKEAFDAAEKVRRYGRAIRLQPMRAGDRRIVHQALKDMPDIETVSEAEDAAGQKRVVIRLKEGGEGPAPDAAE